MTDPPESRTALSKARRLIIKIGSRVLVQPSGRPDTRRMKCLVREIAALQRQGREIIVVSSGAVGAGMEALGLRHRPTSIPDLQMAAAVGQSRLMATYDRLFSAEKCRVAQVLLTHDDLKHRERHLNARNAILNLLRHGMIPVVNENDVVATEEIKFGDNDTLAALVAALVPTDLLVLLTTTDGLRDRSGPGRIKRVATIEKITPEILALADDTRGDFSTGGMAAKLEAARTAVDVGVPVVIANGRREKVLAGILEGRDVGTLCLAPRSAAGSTLRGRKRWIAFFHKAQGTLVIDDGARNALQKLGKSLLPIGITRVEGQFNIGALVNVNDRHGAPVARGLVDYGSDNIRKIHGLKTSEIAGILGTKDFDAVIHRDNMVLFE
jgi:glutamate 5-kinase